MANETVILIFAKAPVPGAVKTRMIPALGAEGAAMLHTALVERVIETAISTRLDVVLCCAPDTTHRYFQDCAEDFGLSLAAQLPADNLGQRMLHSLNEALLQWPQALLIGADCAAFGKKHLLEAAEKLTTHDVIVTPAEDGGYVLIGANKTRVAMFDNIEWGTEKVMAQQRVAFDAAALDWVEMPTLWDVDRPEDLPRLQTIKPAFEFFWPA